MADSASEATDHSKGLINLPATRDKVFISYSHKDAGWLKKLRTMLKPLERSGRLLLWDDDSIPSGAKWRAEIQQALDSARAAILLVTDNFLASDFVMRVELPAFLKAAEAAGLRLFVILVSHCLYDRTPLKDFQLANDPDAPLDSLSGPRQKKLLAGIAREIDDLLAAPALDTAPTARAAAPEGRRADIFRLPLTDYTLFGREGELARLQAAWRDADVNMATVVAFGGTGKTALVNHFLRNLQDSDWGGAERVFGWSFFNQGSSEDKQVSSDLFLAEALRFFGVADPGPIAAWEKGRLLAESIRSRRVLLVLDGVEPLQEEPGPRGGYLRDQGLLSLLLELAAENSGLCLVTTRIAIEDLATVNPRNLLQIDLTQLTPTDGANFLRHLGVTGDENELQDAVREFDGHALALRLLGNYLTEVYNGDVRHRDAIGRLEDDEQAGHHARRVMASYEEWFAGKPELQILFMMGLFDRPIEPGALAALRREPAIAGLTEAVLPLDEVKWRYALGRLRKVGLITEEGSRIDCHPLVREHFATRLQVSQPAAWRESHARLFEHFRDEPATPTPTTLEELDPLFESVSHGCRAGRQVDAFTDVYWPRISRAEEAYCTHTLGAVAADLGALRNFFVAPWSRLAEGFAARVQAWLFNQAGYDLRSLGRLDESRQPIEAGLALGLADGDWKNAARCANNLARIHLMLGEMPKAIDRARAAVAYADNSGNRFHALAYRSNLAHVLYQAGSVEAERLFLEVEDALQKQPLPAGAEVRSNQYWDFLLGQNQFALVRRRAEESLADMDERPLDAALDQLTYARAMLLEWETGRQARSEAENRATEDAIDKNLGQAVTRLRQAGRQHEIPRGLLARAAFRRLQGDAVAARRDVDEAFALAQRNGMKLHEVDCELELARLALSENDVPAARRAMEQAEAGVTRTGYHRRDADLRELERLMAREPRGSSAR